jgi:hypothetical protein
VSKCKCKRNSGDCQCATRSDVTKDELLRECADKLERGIESACATEPEWSKQDRKLVSRIKAALEQAQ